MNPKAQKEWILERLKHSLQALALPGEQQVQLFPRGVVVTDELVLDFDHWRSCVVGNDRSEFTEAQSRAIAALSEKIKSAPNENDKSVWHEEALCLHSFWIEVRKLAARALETFGWPAEVPPDYKHEYVLDPNAHEQ